MIPAKADKMLRSFIISGGFDIDDLFEYGSIKPYSIDDNTPTSIAAEP